MKWFVEAWANLLLWVDQVYWRIDDMFYQAEIYWLHPEHVLFGAAAISVLVATRIVMRQRTSDEEYTEENETLRLVVDALSYLWTSDDRRQIALKTVSKVWGKDGDASEAIPDPEIKDPKLRSFYRTYIKKNRYFQTSGVHRQVVIGLVELLDSEGGCPSVVSVEGDAESVLPDRTISRLALVTLRDHSIHVAKNMVQVLTDQNLRIAIPDGIIAALGHDLGKLPSRRDELYLQHDHPLASGIALDTLEGFNSIPVKDRILVAIRNHHRKSEDVLGNALQRADQLARRQELQGEADTSAPAAVSGGVAAGSGAGKGAAGKPGVAGAEGGGPGKLVSASDRKAARKARMQVLQVDSEGAMLPTGVPDFGEEVEEAKQDKQDAVVPGAGTGAQAEVSGKTPAMVASASQGQAKASAPVAAKPVAVAPAAASVADTSSAPKGNGGKPEGGKGGAKPTRGKKEEEPVWDPAIFGGDAPKPFVHHDPPPPPPPPKGDDDDEEGDDGLGIPMTAGAGSSGYEDMEGLDYGDGEGCGEAPGSVAARAPGPDDGSIKGMPIPAPNRTKRSGPQKAAAAWAEQKIIHGNHSQDALTGKSDAAFGTESRRARIDHWFDPEVFLKGIEAEINRVMGNRWSAFSMPDGMVYVSVDLIDRLVREMADRGAEVSVSLLPPRSKEMNEVLLTVVDTFREQQFIPKDALGKNYFGGWYKVIYKNGSNTRGFYTPFTCDAFGLPSELESRKPAKLRRIAKVEADFGRGRSEAGN